MSAGISSGGKVNTSDLILKEVNNMMTKGIATASAVTINST